MQISKSLNQSRETPAARVACAALDLRLNQGLLARRQVVHQHFDKGIAERASDAG